MVGRVVPNPSDDLWPQSRRFSGWEVHRVSWLVHTVYILSWILNIRLVIYKMWPEASSWKAWRLRLNLFRTSGWFSLYYLSWGILHTPLFCFKRHNCGDISFKPLNAWNWVLQKPSCIYSHLVVVKEHRLQNISCSRKNCNRVYLITLTIMLSFIPFVVTALPDVWEWCLILILPFQTRGKGSGMLQRSFSRGTTSLFVIFSMGIVSRLVISKILVTGVWLPY